MMISDAAAKRAAWVWPGIIVSLLVGSVGICAVTVVCAISDPSKSIEKDYYDKAVNWESSAIRQAASDRLGWQVVARIGAPEGPLLDRTVHVELNDADGMPLADQQIKVTLFHHARASQRTTIDLQAVSDQPGIYEATFRNPRAGLWRMELEGLQSPFRVELDLFSSDTQGRG